MPEAQGLSAVRYRAQAFLFFIWSVVVVVVNAVVQPAWAAKAG